MPNTPRPLPRPFTMPWGKGQITEEVQVIREHWEPTIQLMEYEDGAKALRFCSYQGGRFSRNPLILGEEDLPLLREELRRAPRIEELLHTLFE